MCTSQLTFLPNEVLVRVLSSLKDLELYYLIALCRSLHTCALHVLFQRHFPTLSYPSISLDTGNHPPFLLPALNAALFLTELKGIYVHFDSPNIPTLSREIRILTGFVERLSYVGRIRVTFSRVAQRYPSALVERPDLIEAIQRLLDAALKRNCAFIGVTEMTGNWGASTVRHRSRNKRRGGFPLSGMWRPSEGLSWVLANQTLMGSKKRKGEKGEKFLKAPAEGRHQDFDQDWDEDMFQNGCVDTNTGMIFHPLLLHWTMGLLNHTKLAKLELCADSFSRESMRCFLLHTSIPTLIDLKLHGHRVSFDDLTHFMQRHSATLNHLDLSVPAIALGGFRVVSSTRTPVQWLKGLTTKQVSFDFPRLQRLRAPLHCVSWLLLGVSNSAHKKGKEAKYLPQLSHLNITSYHCTPIGSKSFFSELDDVLLTLATFFKLATPPSPSRCKSNSLADCNYGLQQLTIDTHRVQTDSPLNWFKAHAEKGTESPIYALRSITNLRFEHIHNWIKLNNEDFLVIPKFLALFRGLRSVTLLMFPSKLVRIYGTKFWKDFNDACPTLEKIWLPNSWFKMKDLVEGRFYHQRS